MPISAPKSEMLMAPWWSHLQAAKADGKVTKAEVRKDIEPFKQHLNEPEYRSEVGKLLGNTDSLRSTSGAKSAVASLLGVIPMKARVLEKPFFSPGSGVATPDGGGRGPSVHIKADLGEGTAKAVTNAWYKGNTLFVQVYGEADHLTRIVDLPKELDVSVPRPPGFGRFKLVVVDQNGKTLAKGDEFSGVPPPVVRPLGGN